MSSKSHNSPTVMPADETVLVRGPRPDRRAVWRTVWRQRCSDAGAIFAVSRSTVMLPGAFAASEPRADGQRSARLDAWVRPVTRAIGAGNKEQREGKAAATARISCGAADAARQPLLPHMHFAGLLAVAASTSTPDFPTRDSLIGDH